MSKKIELNLTITISPETKWTASLITISESRSLICHTLPMDQALNSLRDEIETRIEDTIRR